jgi:hypothetical protein
MRDDGIRVSARCAYMMTKEFLAEFERRALNGARAYALARSPTGYPASVWFAILEFVDYK